MTTIHRPDSQTLQIAPLDPETPSGQSLSNIETDLLVIPCFEAESVSALAAIDAAAGGEISRAITRGEFEGKKFDTFITPVVDRTWKSSRILLIGGGRRRDADHNLLRTLASAAGHDARKRRVRNLALLVPGQGDITLVAQAMAEGLTLTECDAEWYKSTERRTTPAPHWILVDEVGRDLSTETSAQKGRVVGQCINLARNLVNEPSDRLTPREFALRAAAIVANSGVSIEVLDEQQIAELNMGLLMGVTRGSSEPPRLMVFRYEPSDAPQSPVLGLVGKGITFDAGGLSIKSADGMERMKMDMAGGAAVICALRAIGMLRAPMRVIGVVPAAENMPGPRAVKPGDVLKSAAGKTVEITNTDAEGRLILADGLWLARRLGATHLVDVATLAATVIVTLGRTTAAIFGSPAAWLEQVRGVTDREGERSWPLPLFEEFGDQLKSEVADVANSGRGPGGASAAALFLKEFSGGLPWVHLDIAGPAFLEKGLPYAPKGATGFGVRTLLRYLAAVAAES